MLVLPPPCSPAGGRWGKLDCIFQNKPACLLLTAAWLHGDCWDFTRRGCLEPGIHGDNPSSTEAKRKDFYVALMQTSHLSIWAVYLQGEMHTSTLDWFRHFTQLRKKPCHDHGGSPFLKVCTCTPENLTSKVGHRVLKNFLVDRQPGEVSWKMSLLTCLSGCVHSWLCGTQPMQGCKSSKMSHIILQCVMKMPLQSRWGRSWNSKVQIKGWALIVWGLKRENTCWT